MKANQKMRGSNGKENILFPLDYMYITQGELEDDPSHGGVLNIDYIGRTTKYPYYAPVTSKVVYIDASNGITVIESIDEVNYIDGTTDFFQAMFWHNDNLLYKVGDILNQGDILGRTGTTGYATGDHVHIGVGKGKFTGFTTFQGHSVLKNEYHQYNAFGVNDTELVVTKNYNWRKFDETPTPPSPKQKFDINELLFIYKRSKIL